MLAKTITSQKALLPILQLLLKEYPKENHGQFWQILESDVLSHKIKFPLLEYLSRQLAKEIDQKGQGKIMDWLSAKAFIGSFPMIGKLLQLQLTNGLGQIYEKAIHYIVKGDEWYACDIIAERVFGEGTLVDFETSFTLLERMGEHSSPWIQRSIGIAGHYATKKGLEKEKTGKLFQLMLGHGHKKQLYIKKGIGWAAKTIAKHHPDIIEAHAPEIQRRPQLSQWFLRKIDIGLAMAHKRAATHE